MSVDLRELSLDDKDDDAVMHLLQREGIPGGPSAAQVADWADENGVSVEDIRKAVAGEVPTLADVVHTGDVNTRGVSARDLRKLGEGADEKRAKDAEKASKASKRLAPRNDEAGDDEPLDYHDDDTTNDDLRSELKSRGLSVDGKKADLIERLEADDEENE